MRLLLGALTTISLPVACSMPCSVLVFWVTNNTCSILYLAATRQPAVRKALGLTPLAAAAAAAPSPPDALPTSQPALASQSALTSQPTLTSQSVRGAQLQTAATLGSLAAPLSP